jgi:hypothetical protein
VSAPTASISLGELLENNGCLPGDRDCVTCHSNSMTASAQQRAGAADLRMPLSLPGIRYRLGA